MHSDSGAPWKGGGARRLARWLCALLPAGPEAAHGGGRVRGPDIALPDLPLDLLVHICSFLAVPERVALVSCCRALWARQDLAGSAALWGQLSLGRRVLPAELTAARAGSLAAWLGRRRPALRSVALDGVGDSAAAAAVLGSLARSPLQHLRLLHTKAAGAGLGSALAALPSLTRLELVSCIGALPAELAGLSAGLVVLSVSGNPALGRGEAHGALAPLQHLTTLTRLDASGCDLKYVPPQLSRLQRLQDLDLSSNDLRALTEAGAGWAFEPLERLTALTRLDLSACSINFVPPQLSGLSRLSALDLSSNFGNAAAVDGAGTESFRALECLTALTRLGLARCRLRRLPPQLGALGVLADLDLQANPLGESGDEDAFEVLEGLTALTFLSLRACQLRCLPAALAALRALRALDCGFQQLGAGGGDAFLPLGSLRGLERLDVACNGLQRLPAQLSALSSLQELTLHRNRSLGSEGGVAFGPLWHLTALTQLRMPDCGLKRLPLQLRALPALCDLDVSWNRGLGEEPPRAAFQALLHLQRLTRLDLRDCSLRALPPQLSSLPALGEVDLRYNRGLKGAGAALHRGRGALARK